MTTTNDQRNEIVDLRLQGMTVRQVSAQTGHATNTVMKAWRAYMAEHARVRADEVDAHREELVQRAEHVAQQARTEALKFRRVEQEVVGEDGRRALEVVREGNAAAYGRLLGVELQALREIARLTGAESAVKVDLSGQVDVTISDPRDRLTEYLVGLCPSNN